MKAIKLVVENKHAVEDVLQNVNGKAREHTYDAATVYELADWAEKSLERLGIPKAERKGAVYCATSGTPVPNAYKYTRKATCVRLERRSSGWWLEYADAVRVYKEGGGATLYLTDAQDSKAVAEFRKQYKVQQGEKT